MTVPRGAFYNENEPYAVEWLKNLVQAGHIAPGKVDGRSIVDLKPKDLEGFRQVHCFGGLGGWSYALKLAGWPDDAPVWTGSPPCQPWSQAGRRRGAKDERHLWPAWFKLIKKCRPGVVFGEQVGSPDGLKWFDLVCADLERAGYAIGAADLSAACVGAPHIRQRLYFVAVSREQRREGKRVQLRPGEPRQAVLEAARGGAARELGHASSARSGGHAGAVPRAKTKSERERILAGGIAHEPELAGDAFKLGDASGARSPERPRPEERFGAVRFQGAPSATAGALGGPWANADWWLCQDGKARPAQPEPLKMVDGSSDGLGRLRPGSTVALEGTFPLTFGARARVGRLKGYGNAIVPEVAATFIRAAMSAMIESAPARRETPRGK